MANKLPLLESVQCNAVRSYKIPVIVSAQWLNWLFIAVLCVLFSPSVNATTVAAIPGPWGYRGNAPYCQDSDAALAAKIVNSYGGANKCYSILTGKSGWVPSNYGYSCPQFTGSKEGQHQYYSVEYVVPSTYKKCSNPYIHKTGFYLFRYREFRCPGSTAARRVKTGTSWVYDHLCDLNDQNLNKLKSLGQPEALSCTHNPINLTTGNKFQAETDYQDNGAFPLDLHRYYNSSSAITSSAWGEHWRSVFDRNVEVHTTSTIRTAYVYRADGKVHFFNQTGWQWVPDADVAYQLSQVVDGAGNPAGWQLFTPENAIENYDARGKLLSVRNLSGLTQTLTYDLDSSSGGDDNPETLDRVMDSFGRTLSFHYDNQSRVDMVTDPEGRAYYYSYDPTNNLSSITYPDDTPDDPTDNPVRIYHYEDSHLDSNGKRPYPYALTGITDENGNRFATWAYDAQGRAISSEHAGGTEKGILDYTNLNNGTDPRVKVTNALDKNTVYHFTTLFGVRKVTRVEGQASANCVAANQTYTYDANGNPNTVTDWEGNITDHDYDARNLEIRRIEALGTQYQRSIQTLWHADFRLPTRIDVFDKDPIHLKRTELSYDFAGKLLSRTEIDIATQQSRTTAYTYTAQGLLEAIDGPRTDVADPTIFSYDSSGNLIQVTNALGQVTRITAHDAAGRPLTLIDPNGSVTALAYDARGRLLSRTVDGHASTYGYDAAGNLTGTTLPSGLSLSYRYNAAHQLVGVSDHLGNSVNYFLDPEGNRIKEDIVDPNGTLTRTQSRLFDELSRLVQHLGGAGQQTDFAYDRNGNLIAVTDGRNHATSRAFDALNRLIRSTDPVGGISSSEYNTLDQAIKVTDPNGLTTRYIYNALDDLLRIDSPDTGVTHYLYDHAGNRIQMTDARGEIVRYRYDALNRITFIDYSDDPLDVTFHYDENDAGQNGIGRLTGMVDASGITRYAYDSRANLIEESSSRDG